MTSDIARCAFGLVAPADPALLALDVAFQAAAGSLFPPGTPVAVSNDVRATLAP